MKTDFQKVDFVGITRLATSDGAILANYYLIVADAGCKSDSDVKKGILHDIVSLYIRIRSFSYAKDIVQRYELELNKFRASLYVKRSADVAKKMTTKGRSKTVIIDIMI